MYTRVNTFAKSLNKTKKGERYNALTKRLVEEHGLKTSFNNIKDARAEVARILTLQNVVLTESVKDSREKSDQRLRGAAIRRDHPTGARPRREEGTKGH